MYGINKKKMFYDVTDDFAIVINYETGVYYGINGFGTLVFDFLMKGSSVEDILTALNKIPDIPADIDQRLAAFIEELKNKEIIIEGPTVKNEINMDVALAAKDDFKFSIDEYSDAQELLMADPIHDVDEEAGWQPIVKEDK